MRAVSRPGGECSSGLRRRDGGTICASATTGGSQEITTNCTSIDGAMDGIWGWWSVRTSVRQQPMVVMSPQLPCIARQQALSSWLIALSVMHASKGAAAESRTRMATKLAMRRMLSTVYRFGNGRLVSSEEGRLRSIGGRVSICPTRSIRSRC